MSYERLNRWARTWLTAGLLTAVFTACTSTHIQSTREAAAAGAPPVRNMMVVGVDVRPYVRDPFERDVVTFLRERGVEASASHAQFSLDQMKGDRAQIRQRLVSVKAESVLYVRMADRIGFRRGPPATFEGATLSDVDDFRYSAFTSPGGEINTALGLGARLYRVSDGAVLWSGMVDTILKEDADSLVLMRNIAKTIVAQMAKDKVIP